MEIGVIGMGKMGYSLALNVRDNHHRVLVYSSTPAKISSLEKESIWGTNDLELLAQAFEGRKVFWLMVPAGEAVDKVIAQLMPYMEKGDIIVDGGNSHYRDTVRRAQALRELGMKYVDAGISGGPAGARKGACMMIGADSETFAYLEPVFRDICVPQGYRRMGENGSGHYVKMIHNGIEYGMLQAIAEGFEIMHHAPYDLDFQEIAHVWNNGAVIRGWLMELTEAVFAADPKLDSIKGVIESSGTGLWTVEEALDKKVPVPVIAQSLFSRYRSLQEDTFSGKLIAGLRQQFGGHKVEKL
jgi:6-phosphogluconate dehydrogenase